MKKILFLFVTGIILLASCGPSKKEKIATAKQDSIHIADSFAKEKIMINEIKKNDSIKKNEIKNRENQLSIALNAIKKLTGTIYQYPQSLKITEKYGTPEILDGTNNQLGIAYFPKGFFTAVINKKSGKFLFIKEGKIPNLTIPINVESELKTLYKELLVFRKKSDFHTYGFGIGYKYNKWLTSLKALENEPESREFLKRGFCVGDIQTLGMEYLESKGKETEYSKYIRKILDKELKK